MQMTWPEAFGIPLIILSTFLGIATMLWAIGKMGD